MGQTGPPNQGRKGVGEVVVAWKTNIQESRGGVSLFLFKNSASLPFAKGEEGLLPCLEFIKASNMINNLYTWIVIQKKE